ncbi:hypothetical protein B0H10DRAFT_47360 [Mycena sp. CBHHK59/15]|nr:hypothetical protein B0H10DRAFT_47360 [Mycena sp. CBHHK59/15]
MDRFSIAILSIRTRGLGESKSTASATWDSGEDAGKRGVEEGGVGATCLEDLSKAYNFTACGASMYDMAAVNAFQSVDPVPSTPTPCTPPPPRENSQSCAAPRQAQCVPELLILQDDAARLRRRRADLCQQRYILPHYDDYDHAALRDLVRHLHHRAPHHDPEPRTRITLCVFIHSFSHSFILLCLTNSFPLQFDCSCTDDNTYAYVYPDEFRAIYLCGVFWEFSTTGTNSHRRQDYAGRRSWWGTWGYESTWGGLDDECTA